MGAIVGACICSLWIIVKLAAWRCFAKSFCQSSQGLIEAFLRAFVHEVSHFFWILSNPGNKKTGRKILVTFSKDIKGNVKIPSRTSSCSLALDLSFLLPPYFKTSSNNKNIPTTPPKRQTPSSPSYCSRGFRSFSDKPRASEPTTFAAFGVRGASLRAELPSLREKFLTVS